MTTQLVATAAAPRTAQVERTTTETSVRLSLVLDGRGETAINTGVGFLDHMLTLLAVHAGFDLALTCEGDLNVDDHHTAEDCAIVLGRGLDAALGDRSRLARYGASMIPMDEALARCALDLVTRPCAVIDLGLKRRVELGGRQCCKAQSEDCVHDLTRVKTRRSPGAKTRLPRRPGSGTRETGRLLPRLRPG